MNKLVYVFGALGILCVGAVLLFAIYERQPEFEPTPIAFGPGEIDVCDAFFQTQCLKEFPEGFNFFYVVTPDADMHCVCVNPDNEEDGRSISVKEWLTKQGYEYEGGHR
jgi:hypothetical protein